MSEATTDAILLQLLEKINRLLQIAIETREATVKKPIPGGASAYDQVPPPPGPMPSFHSTPSPAYPQEPAKPVKTVPDLPSEHATHPTHR